MVTYLFDEKIISLDKNQAEDIMCHSGRCNNVDLLVPWLAKKLFLITEQNKLYNKFVLYMLAPFQSYSHIQLSWVYQSHH